MFKLDTDRISYCALAVASFWALFWPNMSRKFGAFHQFGKFSQRIMVFFSSNVMNEASAGEHIN